MCGAWRIQAASGVAAEGAADHHPKEVDIGSPEARVRFRGLSGDLRVELAQGEERHLGVEVVLDVVVHVEIEEPAHEVGPEGPRALDDRGRVLLHLRVLDDVEHQHDRPADEPRQDVEPEGPGEPRRDEAGDPEVREREEARVPGHLRKLRFRGHVAHELRVSPGRELPQHPELEPEDREAAHVVEPAPEIERGVERHLAVEADVPGVRVVVGVGVAAVERLFAVEEGRDPEDRFVEPSSTECGSVRRLVAEGVGGDGQDDAVQEHRRPHPDRPQREPHEKAGQEHCGGPRGEIGNSRSVAPARERLQPAPVDADAGGGGIGDEAAHGPSDPPARYRGITAPSAAGATCSA